MKNKKAIYILLPLVLIIWGIIFYRIVAAVDPQDELKTNNFSNSATIPAQSPIDTFNIIADYRDPFLGKMAVANVENDKPKIPVKKIEKPKPEPIQWPTILYRGMIKNQKTGKQLYLVTINNQDNMMLPGDVFLDVELQKVYKDSIEVLYRKEKRVIKK